MEAAARKKGREVESQLACKLELSAVDVNWVRHCSQDDLTRRKGNSQALHWKWGFDGLPFLPACMSLFWVKFVAYKWV